MRQRTLDVALITLGLLGLIGTAACAIAASLASAVEWLIAIRLVQGACAALVVPGTLGLLRLFIPDDEERLRAMTWWSGISIAGSAAGPIALVLGAEGKGLRPSVAEACEARARIPIASVMESLNVSAAAAISLYEAARGRRGG